MSASYKYNVHPTQITQWKKEIQQSAASLFDGKRGQKSIEDHCDIDRLYTEIGRLTTELDWLQKKSGLSVPVR